MFFTSSPPCPHPSNKKLHRSYSLNFSNLLVEGIFVGGIWEDTTVQLLLIKRRRRRRRRRRRLGSVLLSSTRSLKRLFSLQSLSIFLPAGSTRLRTYGGSRWWVFRGHDGSYEDLCRGIGLGDQKGHHEAVLRAVRGDSRGSGDLRQEHRKIERIRIRKSEFETLTPAREFTASFLQVCRNLVDEGSCSRWLSGTRNRQRGPARIRFHSSGEGELTATWLASVLGRIDQPPPLCKVGVLCFLPLYTCPSPSSSKKSSSGINATSYGQ